MPLTFTGASRYITVVPLQAHIGGVTPSPLQTKPSWIAAKIAAVSDLLVNGSINRMFVGPLWIPCLTSVALFGGAYVAPIATPVSIKAICNDKKHEIMG